MKTVLNKALFVEFKRTVGRETAIDQLEKCLGCSRSKAVKLADGRYRSEMSLSEKLAVAKLLKASADALYLEVGKPRAKAS